MLRRAWPPVSSFPLPPHEATGDRGRPSAPNTAGVSSKPPPAGGPRHSRGGGLTTNRLNGCSKRLPNRPSPAAAAAPPDTFHHLQQEVDALLVTHQRLLEPRREVQLHRPLHRLRPGPLQRGGAIAPRPRHGRRGGDRGRRRRPAPGGGGRLRIHPSLVE